MTAKISTCLGDRVSSRPTWATFSLNEEEEGGERRGAGGRGGGWEHGLVVEHLPGMCEVPESIPGIKKQTTKTLKVDLKSWKRSKPISKESENT